MKIFKYLLCSNRTLHPTETTTVENTSAEELQEWRPRKSSQKFYKIVHQGPAGEQEAAHGGSDLFVGDPGDGSLDSPGEAAVAGEGACWGGGVHVSEERVLHPHSWRPPPRERSLLLQPSSWPHRACTGCIRSEQEEAWQGWPRRDLGWGGAGTTFPGICIKPSLGGDSGDWCSWKGLLGETAEGPGLLYVGVWGGQEAGVRVLGGGSHGGT
nr:uncharacterized protein LOC106783448 isoform X2 [Equus caballus]